MLFYIQGTWRCQKDRKVKEQFRPFSIFDNMKHFCLKILLTAILTMVTTLGEAVIVDGIYYDLSGNEATVTRGNYSGEIMIPATINYDGVSYNVTSISSWAFAGNTDLNSVIISEGVREIGNFAFGDCSNLSNIVIPNSLTTIGSGIFSGCSGLTNPVYNGGRGKYLCLAKYHR